MEKEKIRSFIMVICILFSVFVVVGIIVLGLFSVPDGDDFHDAYYIREFMKDGIGYFEATLKNMYNYYTNWQGTWFSIFVISFVSPFLRGGLELYSVNNTIIITLFFLSLFVFISVFCRKFYHDNKLTTAVFCAVVTAGWLATSESQELFYWFFAECDYTVTLTCVFVSLSCILISGNCQNPIVTRGLIAISSVLGFCVGGGGLNVLGLLLTSLLMIILCYDRRSALVPFIVTMIATLTNILAPGYRVRYQTGTNAGNQYDSLIESLVHSIANTAICIARLGYRLLCSPVFYVTIVVALIFIFIMGDSVRVEMTRKRISLSLLMSVLMIFSVTFPVCFGYGSDRIAGRTESVALLTIWLFGMYWVSVLAYVIKENTLKTILNSHNNLKQLIVFMCIIVYIAVFLMSRNTSVRAYRELISGYPQTAWENWHDIYDLVENSDDSCLEIDLDNPFYGGLLVKNTIAFWNDEMMISPSYMKFCGKDKLIVNWTDRTYAGER